MKITDSPAAMLVMPLSATAVAKVGPLSSTFQPVRSIALLLTLVTSNQSARNGLLLPLDQGETLLQKTALNEKGQVINGRGDTPNTHDILTGSDSHGYAFPAGQDTTCGNWTKSGEGSAMVGHADRMGLRDDAPSKSWNMSHPSRGCSSDALRSSGGGGLSMGAGPAQAGAAASTTSVLGGGAPVTSSASTGRMPAPVKPIQGIA